MTFRSAHGAGSHGERGFTLIELLVVIVILGILSAVVVFAVRGSGNKGKKAAVATDQQIIRTALEVYCIKNGQYPKAEPGPPVKDAMQVLVDGKFLGTRPTYWSLTTGDTGDGNCPGGGPGHYKLVEVDADPGSNNGGGQVGDNPTWTSETTIPLVGFAGVSCTDSSGTTTCVAVGTNDTQGASYRGASTGSGSATINWTAGNVPASVAGLSGVDCVDASTCTAVGWGGASCAPPMEASRGRAKSPGQPTT